MDFTKTDAKLFFEEHPDLQQQFQDYIDTRKQALEEKRKYLAATKNELKEALERYARRHQLVFFEKSKTVWGFTNPKNHKSVTFAFSNGKNYTADPKHNQHLEKFTAKSWHVVKANDLKDKPADYFVFFITRRKINETIPIVFTNQEMQALTKDQSNFYFGVTKDNHLIEDRHDQQQFANTHLGFTQLLDDLQSPANN